MNWISILDGLYGPLCYLLIYPMINNILRPKRSFIWMLGVAAFMTGFTYAMRLYKGWAHFGVLIQIVGLWVPMFILYPKEKFFRNLYCGSVFLLGELAAVPISTLIVGLMTGTFDVGLEYAQTPLQLMRNGLELMILLPATYLLLLPMRRHRDAGINWAAYAIFISAQGVTMMVALLGMWLNTHLLASQAYVLVLCVIACVAADVILYRTMRRNVGSIQAEAENAALRQLQQMQLLHSRELQDQLNQTSVLRHDMNNHLNALNLLLAHDPARGMEYLRNLIETLPGKSGVVFCPNPAINAVLHAKTLTAKERGTELNVRLQLPTALPFDDVDLVSAFSNLLDNALEACANGDDIEIAASVKSAHLVIRCQNPCVRNLVFEDGLPVSTKGAGRGIGTRSVRQTARKYSGEASFALQDDVFCATVALPITR